jgi:ribose transport system ATP-binding protein
MESIIKFENIYKRFGGVRALNNVSFEILEGEVHVVAGENGAGKSTLINLLSGIYEPDGGSIIYKGKPVRISSPSMAKNLGIATVYQELKLCSNLNVTENIFMGREIRKNKFGLNKKKMNLEAREVLRSYGLDIAPTEQVSSLSVAQMQLVEIARAIGLNSKVLILDEPTSSLTENETRRLFENIRAMKNEGVTTIFISHRLEEVFEIADRISILRNGEYLSTYGVNDITPNEVVALIAGKTVEEVERKVKQERVVQSAVVLEVENLSRGRHFKNVSFQLHKGEILGFYGLQGAGRSELIETVFGLYRKDGGTIKINGNDGNFRNPKDAIKRGLSFVPEDRKLRGVFPLMSVMENIAVVHSRKVSNSIGMISFSKILSMCNNYVKKLSIKVGSVRSSLISLSGGNQQKVIIARGLSTDPEILLMDEPTRGVDVGAKAEIFNILRELREKEGKSIIIISSELGEVINECDRVLVMKNGEICGEVKGTDVNRKELLDLAFNGRRSKEIAN